MLPLRPRSNWIASRLIKVRILNQMIGLHLAWGAASIRGMHPASVLHCPCARWDVVDAVRVGLLKRRTKLYLRIVSGLGDLRAATCNIHGLKRETQLLNGLAQRVFKTRFMKVTMSRYESP